MEYTGQAKIKLFNNGDTYISTRKNGCSVLTVSEKGTMTILIFVAACAYQTPESTGPLNSAKSSLRVTLSLKLSTTNVNKYGERIFSIRLHQRSPYNIGIITCRWMKQRLILIMHLTNPKEVLP